MKQVIMPLGGRGGRFQERGYTFPKPLIEIGGKSMIERVLDNLAMPAETQFTFICRKEHLNQFYLGSVLQLLRPGCRIIPLENETAGALCSILLAVDQLKQEEEILVANGDQIIDQPLPNFYTTCAKPGIDGAILTFQATHPRWSFVQTDEKGLVRAVAEKRPISRQATAGLYYFRRCGDLFEAAERMILKGLRTEGQFFICPVYNEFILEGKIVSTHHLPDGAMHSLGTPEDVEEYVQRLRMSA
jgi:NDP-sugar pyrophosphorylase family protein